MAKSDKASAAEAQAGTSTTKWISPSVLQGAIQKFGSRVQTGTYIGTGACGSANPNSLTFDFVPKFLLVADQSSYGYHTSSGFDSLSIVWIPGVDLLQPGSVGDSGVATSRRIRIELISTTVRWFLAYEYASEQSGYSRYQLNVSGRSYPYIAIG